VQKIYRYPLNFQRLQTCGRALKKLLRCQASSSEGCVRVCFGTDDEFGGEIFVSCDGFRSAISLRLCKWLFLDRRGKGAEVRRIGRCRAW
jgi:hypothetical protein